MFLKIFLRVASLEGGAVRRKMTSPLTKMTSSSSTIVISKLYIHDDVIMNANYIITISDRVPAMPKKRQRFPLPPPHTHSLTVAGTANIDSRFFHVHI